MCVSYNLCVRSGEKIPDLKLGVTGLSSELTSTKDNSWMMSRFQAYCLRV